MMILIIKHKDRDRVSQEMLKTTRPFIMQRSKRRFRITIYLLANFNDKFSNKLRVMKSLKDIFTFVYHTDI